MLKFFLRLFTTLFLITFLFVCAVTIYFITIDKSKINSIISSLVEKNFNVVYTADHIDINVIKGINLKNVTLKTKKGKKIISSIDISIIIDPLALLKNKNIKILQITLNDNYINYNEFLKLINELLKRKSDKKSNILLSLYNIKLNKTALEWNNYSFFINGNINFNGKTDIFDAEFLLNVKSVFATGILKGTLNNFNLTSDLFEVNKFITNLPEINIKNIKADLKFTSNYILYFKINPLYVSYIFSNILISNIIGTYNNNNQETLIKNTYFYLDEFRYFRISQIKYQNKERLLNITTDIAKIPFSDYISNVNGDFSLSLNLTYKTNFLINAKLNTRNLSYSIITNAIVSCNIKDNILNLNGILDTEGGSISIFIPDTYLYDKNLSFFVNIATLDIEKVVNHYSSLRKIDNNSNDINFSNYNITPTLPSFIDSINVVFSLNKLYYQIFNLDNIKGTLYISNNYMKLPYVSFDAIKGRASLVGEIVSNRFNVSLSLSNVRMKDVSDSFLPSTNRLYGIANLYSEINGFYDKKFNYRGFVNINIKNGQFKNLFLQNKIDEMFPELDLNDIYFQDINLNALITDERIDITNFNYLSSNIKIYANGWLNTKNIDIKSIFEIRNDYLVSLPNIARLLVKGNKKGDFYVFNLDIWGNIRKPDYKFNK